LKCLRFVEVIFVLFLISMATLPSMAEETTSQKTRLQDMEVVASPVIEGNAVDRYGSEKTTVSEEQIRDLNAQDVSSALRRTPGVNISRYDMIGSFGGATGGAVFIRGMGASRPGAEIKTLVDGVPMYMSVWNHPLLDLMSIDPANEVEVYKSPQPYLFGNAFGVVNIVPKRQEAPGFDTRAEAAGGSYGTWLTKGEHGGRQGDFDYYLGGGYRTSDGDRDKADGELKDLYGRVGYALGNAWDVSCFTLYNDNYADDPGAEGADPAQRQGRYETRTWLSILTLENHLDTAEGHIKLYRNAGEGDWLDQPTSTSGVREDLFNDFLFYGLKAKETFHLWSAGEIIAGLDWDVTAGQYELEDSDGTRDRWDGHDFKILSPYLAVSQQFGSKDGLYAIPSAGARYYDNSDFDAQWSPHAGLVIGYQKTELHAGYSHGVIYPGLDVVVLSEKIIPMLGSSWKDLDAETVDHYEVGLQQRFGSLATADVTWFYDDGRDRYVIVPPPPPPPVFANVGHYQIQGVETSIKVYPAEDLALFAGLTYLDTDPSNLPYAPEFTFSAGINWRFLRVFHLSLDCQYVDDMFVGELARNSTAHNTNTVDSYFLLNAKLSYDFVVARTLGLDGEIYVAGENLTDTDYEFLPGYPMPGITGMAGVSFKL
jgi:outer membrane cobalamin receptor